MIEITLAAYVMILLACGIFLTLAFKYPRLAVLAILSGIAIIAVGVISASQQFTILGISMVVLGIAPLVPVVAKEYESESVIE